MSRDHPVRPQLGCTLVEHRPDIVMVEELLAALKGAGVPKGWLVDTFNAVQAALVGFVTQELACMAENLSACQENMRRGSRRYDPVA